MLSENLSGLEKKSDFLSQLKDVVREKSDFSLFSYLSETICGKMVRFNGKSGK